MKSKFADWLLTKYFDWQKKMDGVKSQTEFANYLGISRIQINRYLNGVNLPNDETIKLLAEKLGDDVYDSLGLVRPTDEELKALIEVWYSLPKEKRRLIINEAGAEYKYKENTINE